jgi:hypothetical protein
MKPVKRFTSYPYMSQSDLNQELWDACLKGDLEQLQYVLHSPELNIYADIYYNNGDCFFWAYERNHMNIVNYLLYDEQYIYSDKFKEKYKLEIINLDLSDANKSKITFQEINDLFKKRDLYFELKDLPSKSSGKVVKI